MGGPYKPPFYLRREMPEAKVARPLTVLLVVSGTETTSSAGLGILRGRLDSATPNPPHPCCAEEGRLATLASGLPAPLPPSRGFRRGREGSWVCAASSPSPHLPDREGVEGGWGAMDGRGRSKAMGGWEREGGDGWLGSDWERGVDGGDG